MWTLASIAGKASSDIIVARESLRGLSYAGALQSSTTQDEFGEQSYVYSALPTHSTYGTGPSVNHDEDGGTAHVVHRDRR